MTGRNPAVADPTPAPELPPGAEGTRLSSRWLTTLHEVRSQTTQGDRQIIFSAGGPTRRDNLHLHGGDVTLKSWTGYERSL